jgi:alkanesulfonate monooxygenase
MNRTASFTVQLRPFVETSSAAGYLKMVEQAGLEQIAIESPGETPDNYALAAFALLRTSRLRILIAHRTGLVPPTVAAQQLAMLDQLGRGRLAMRVVPGSQPDRSTDWETLNYEASLKRSDEYLVLLKRLWLNEKPFDYEGRFYSLRDGQTSTKPFGRNQVPMHLGGFPGAAVSVAAKHADVFMLPPGTVAEVRWMIARIRAEALPFGRADRIRFSLPIMPVVGDTHEEAWLKAAGRSAGAGWKARAATRLVGTAAQIAVALMEYRDLGIDEFVVHELDAPEDVALFGQTVAPLLRRSIARRSAA